MKRLIRSVCLLVLSGGLCVADVQATATGDTTLVRARLEARQVLQGVLDSPFLDSLEVERTARAIDHIYSSVPEVRGISNYGDRTYMVLSLSDLGTSQVDTIPSDPEAGTSLRTRTVAQVGIGSIDSLNARFDVDSVEVRYSHGRARRLRPYFNEAPNVPVLARHYMDLPEIRYAGPELFVGDGDWIMHFRKDGLWYLVFSRGSGDCPSGCIRRDYYYVTHDPIEGRSELVDTLLDGKFKTDRVHLWGIPSRLSVMPYRDHEDLFSRMEDPRWWERQQAVSVIWYLLRDPEEPWRGDGTQDRGHFTILKEAVGEHRIEVLLLLSDRVADEDDWVRRAAQGALREVAGVDYGEGEDGRLRWREWVRTEAGTRER